MSCKKERKREVSIFILKVGRLVEVKVELHFDILGYGFVVDQESMGIGVKRAVNSEG